MAAGNKYSSNELEREIKELEQLFWVSGKKLQQITLRFIEELEEGLAANGKTIPMNITWVEGFPTGNETGTYLTLDLGGTNLRVCKVTLSGKGQHSLTQKEYQLPDELKKSSAYDLWSYIADSLRKFIDEHPFSGHHERNPIPLGFTFSYPATQHSIDHGILQTWTKGLEISGVEGEDVARQLRDAMTERDLPIRLVALANDTVGALMASAYADPNTIIGAIFGTGCNGAYMENVKSIRKIQDKHHEYDQDAKMAINCEYGAFDNELRVLPRTKYDSIVDEQSPKPGEQAFEKMSAGLYLGEIFRLVVRDLHTRGLLFKDQNARCLDEGYSIDTAFLSKIEDDDGQAFAQAVTELEELLGLSISENESGYLRRLAEMINTRGARLCVCGVAAICKKQGIKEGHVAADGGVVKRSPKFKARWDQAIREVLELESEEDTPIRLTSAEDGSGVGLTIITAMTMGKGK
ncbi:hexokinase [Patellaria atrata CBS 101060]|uniref:Phosphotransferase n=1 Tax=Patellaria atrata CBS 101060 TaxID=1346257 RepID=A0A9P4VPT0_9PEZI|nr:hexokinase [Patellaria atrata CBS 101060]